MFKELWKYRDFIIASVQREFKTQYSKSILGAAWVVFNPLYMCVIYTSIFSSVLNRGGSKLSYTIYVGVGLLAWNFFTDILNRSQAIYLNYANIIKKQYFPLHCLPVVVFVLASIDFFISFGLFTGYLVATGAFPGWCYLAVIPVWFILAMYSLVLGTVLGTLNIFFRDIGRVMVVVLQVWFWMTPIVYFIDAMPENMQTLLMYNPLTAIMSAYQTIFVQQQWPHWSSLLFTLVVTGVISSAFFNVYNKHAVEILDEL